MTDSTKLLTCASFRVLRDAYQTERRKIALPMLKAELAALNAEIQPLAQRWRDADKHSKQSLEFELKPLWERQSYVLGQLAVIEK
jgi:hypothetical protein